MAGDTGSWKSAALTARSHCSRFFGKKFLENTAPAEEKCRNPLVSIQAPCFGCGARMMYCIQEPSFEAMILNTAIQANRYACSLLI